MLERKIIRPGEGARITFQEYVGGWRGYRSRTLIVRVPGPRVHTFRVADVITEGIQGQPQLTFDSRDAAMAWKAAHPEYSEWNVGRINREYTCIKIPLEDGSEAWLAESNFPDEGSEEWDRLVRLYPDYFTVARLGFFESKVTEAYEEHEVAANRSWKIKTPGTFCYRIKINLPGKRYHTFRWALSSCTPHVGGPAWQEACFLTKEDADRFIAEHDLREYPTGLGDTTGPWYSYEARIPLTLIKVPLEDGTEVYLRKEAFPREYNYSNELNQEAHEWWEDVRQRYPEYFKKIKLGFFNEDLSLTEAYNVSPETFKRVIIKYVKDNGYIKGGWNGRYMTTSPTVAEINKILRHESDLTEYMCTPEEYEEVNEWVQNVVPEGPMADWMTRCKESWDKTNNLGSADLQNLVSFVSYRDSNLKYQQRQAARQQREQEHQNYVDSDANAWVGEIGEEVSFTVAEAKISGYVAPHSYYASEYPIWKIKDTDGHVYSWGDTKNQVQIEPNMKITGKVKAHREFRGVKETQITRITIKEPSGLGFFKESFETDNWLKQTTGWSEAQLKEMCDKNWNHELELPDDYDDDYDDDDYDDDCFSFEDGNRLIANIFLDDNGTQEFDNLDQVFEYYGEDWTKEWIERFYNYCEEIGESPKSRLGFFTQK